MYAASKKRILFRGGVKLLKAAEKQQQEEDESSSESESQSEPRSVNDLYIYYVFTSCKLCIWRAINSCGIHSEHDFKYILPDIKSKTSEL